MTTVVANTLAGENWDNVFNDEDIVDFQYSQIAPASLSPDHLSLTFFFAGGDTVTFESDAGFGMNPPSGIINGASGSSGEAIFTDMSVSLASFFAAMRDGDADALNALVWSGADVINGGASDDLIHGFGGADRLLGNDGADTLWGDLGNDLVWGGNGADFLLGGAGNDRLYGQDDADMLSGGAGLDQLIGGRGRDQLTGGTGADQFIWNHVAEFAPIVANQPYSVDFIRDFSSLEGDKINFHLVDANSAAAGNQDFTFLGSGAFTANTPGQVHIVATPNSLIWRVELNTDMDSAAEYAVMVISHNGAPVAGDFVL